jgi:hypothetical protein
MEQVQEAADQARQKVQEAGGEARNRARDQIDQRSTQAGERVSATAGDVRSVGEELRKQGRDGPARMADQVADRAERLGGYLKDADADRILGDVEEAGRRQPWAVVAGGLALGFAASRFLKASSRERYQSSRGSAGNGRVRTPDPDVGNGQATGGAYSASPGASAIPAEPPSGGSLPSRS